MEKKKNDIKDDPQYRIDYFRANKEYSEINKHAPVQNNKIQKRIFCILCLHFIALIFAAYFSYGAYINSRDELIAIKEQFATENRAWVNFSNSEKGTVIDFNKGKCRVSYTVSGNSPTIDAKFIGYCHTTSELLSENKIIESVKKSFQNEENIHYLPDQIKGDFIKEFKSQQTKCLEDSKFVILYGKITYDDIFKKSHETNFCYYTKYECKGFNENQRIEFCEYFNNSN